MNMHISEVVSDILDPVVETYKGGCEIISTEDLIARLEILNGNNKHWNKYSYWVGMVEGRFKCCGICVGTDIGNNPFDEGVPELCQCEEGRRNTNNTNNINSTNSINSTTSPKSEKSPKIPKSPNPKNRM